MPTALIESFGNLASWQALTPANAPSVEIATALDDPSPALPTGGQCMRVTVTPAAAGHRVTTAVPAADLSDFSELRFWVRGSVPANGQPAQPFRLELRLGAAALPINAPGNDWHRRVPIAPSSSWSLVRVALDDLPGGVRAAMTEIALFVLPGDGGFTVWLDDLRAASPQMVADADEALLAMLDGILQIGGNPVPASFEVPGGAAVASPGIRIVNYDAVFADERGSQGQRRGDFTSISQRIYPEAEPWDLHYRIDFIAGDAAEQAAMLDFTLRQLGGGGIVNIGGLPHRIDRLPSAERDVHAPGPLLRYAIATSGEAGQAIQVMPVAEVRLLTDLEEAVA